MRFRHIPQMTIDGIPIEDIEFDMTSRHSLIAILVGLQHLYSKSRDTLERILDLIEADLRQNKKKLIGRIGLSCWEVLVFASIRLGCDFDYDHLADEACNHNKLRFFLGLGRLDEKRFARSTIHDNINCLQPTTLAQISQLVVDCGHATSPNALKPNALKRVRADSFVTKKNIHYPTDSSLIADGIRRVVALCHDLSQMCGIPGWQQHEYLKRKAKRILRKLSNNTKRKSGDKHITQQALYKQLFELSVKIIDKAEYTLSLAAEKAAAISDARLNRMVCNYTGEIQYFIAGIEYVQDLARRRVFNEEKIPNVDKVFSLFEPDTELINRGKTPNPIEFGHRVLVVEDNAGFILHCRQMDIGFTDEKVIVEVMQQLQHRFNGRIQAVSLDKGFWTPTNLVELQKIIPLVGLPKKGRLDDIGSQRESSKPFKKIRKWHSGVESRIHSLMAGNGMSLCRDKGATGYERYVAMASLGRNLLTLGRILIEKERKRRARKNSLKTLVANLS